MGKPSIQRRPYRSARPFYEKIATEFSQRMQACVSRLNQPPVSPENTLTQLECMRNAVDGSKFRHSPNSAFFVPQKPDETRTLGSNRQDSYNESSSANTLARPDFARRSFTTSPNL